MPNLYNIVLSFMYQKMVYVLVQVIHVLQQQQQQQQQQHQR